MGENERPGRRWCDEPGLDQQRYAERRVTQPLISQKNSPGITRLPAGKLAGFCCDEGNCPECLRAYREGLAFMRQDRAARVGQVAPRKLRKPSIRKLVEQAEKTGKRVTSVTTPDGMIINFGEPEPSAANNPWLDDLKVTKQ